VNDSNHKLNVLPGQAAVALLLAVAALAAAVVAIGKSNDNPAQTAAAGSRGDSMSSMSSEDMDQMAPISIAGISKAPADIGNAPLKGTLRRGVLEFTLDARPVWWRIFGKQQLLPARLTPQRVLAEPRLIDLSARISD
jgi:hypothetical protein